MKTAVDLRSDTITQPTEGMRQAMYDAPVGDDVFDEDPTIQRLQAMVADAVGMECGLFVPSGTMANQLALLVHCRPGDDVLVGKGAHMYMYESGAGAAIAGVQFSIIGDGGHFSAEDVSRSVKQTDAAGHIPPTTLLTVENTHNRGGGIVMPSDTFEAIASMARSSDLAVHIDGARIFNAAIAAGCTPAAWGLHADTISVCLSKGLGAPVGSVLCGTEKMIHRAHRYRKMMGGGMRQAGVIAAAGIYALQHHVAGLADDHRRARHFAEHIATLPRGRVDLSKVATNIVMFDVDGSASEICDALNDDVRILPVGPQSIRAVFHHQVDDAGLERAKRALTRVLD